MWRSIYTPVYRAYTSIYVHVYYRVYTSLIHPPQVSVTQPGVKRLDNDIRPSREWNGPGCKNFVRISACWSTVDTWSNRIVPFLTWSLIVWQSISICFVRSWNTGFEAMWIADLLSQKSLVVDETAIFKSWRSCSNHMISHVTWLWYHIENRKLQELKTVFSLT